MSCTPPARIRPIASLPEIPTVPTTFPLLPVTKEVLPLPERMREATPAPAAVTSACDVRYCAALLRRSPVTHGTPEGSLIHPRPPSAVRPSPLLEVDVAVTVRTVPSLNTNVSERISPRTHD